jgi:hypothetical protein
MSSIASYPRFETVRLRSKEALRNINPAWRTGLGLAASDS